MKFWRYWFPVLVYMGIIFYFSSRTGDQVSLLIPDYLAHGVEYAGLGFLLFRAWRGTWPGVPTRRAMVWAVVTAILYGVTDEWHQSFVPGRTASVKDLVANGVGAALGQMPGVYLEKWAAKRAKK
ncbi:MAG: VanZ family protein [Thermincolia bacterium]